MTADDTTTVYGNLELPTVAADVDYFAKYFENNPVKHYQYFNLNGGKMDGSLEYIDEGEYRKLEYSADNRKTVSDKPYYFALGVPSVTRAGYELVGWFLYANGSYCGKNEAGEEVTAASISDGLLTSEYSVDALEFNSYTDYYAVAKWELCEYTITVNSTNLIYSFHEGESSTGKYYVTDNVVYLKFEKIKGYDIPVFNSPNFTLTIGGEEIDIDAEWEGEWSYSYEKAYFWFNCGKITGDVVVTITGTSGNVYWHDQGVRASEFSNIDNTKKVVVINSAAELGLLNYQLNYGTGILEGYTIELADDINLSGYKWMPMRLCFNAFNGNGYKIGGIDISVVPGKSFVGFFGSVYDEGDCDVCDLHLEGAISGSMQILDSYYIGGLMGYNNGASTYRNIVADVDINIGLNGLSDSRTSYVGGLIGFYIGVDNVSCIKNCYSTANITVSGDSCYRLGGIAGCVREQALYNCYHGGTINSALATNTDNYIYGAVGSFTAATFENVYYCSSSGLDSGIDGRAEGLSLGDMTAVSGDNALVKKLNDWAIAQNVAAGKDIYKYWGVVASENNGMPQFGLDINYLNDDGEKFTTLPADYDYAISFCSGAAFTLPTSIPGVKLGYVFDGWYTEAVGGNKVIEIAFGTAEDQTVYAHWAKAFANSGETGIDGSTADKAFEIAKKAQLKNLATLINNALTNEAHGSLFYKLTADIVLNDGVFTAEGYIPNGGVLTEYADLGSSTVEEWIPIGINTAGKQFRGFFDGNGRSISGIYVKGLRCRGWQLFRGVFQCLYELCDC